jgi:hypothetical protein
MTRILKYIISFIAVLLIITFTGCSSSTTVTVSYDEIEKLFAASYPSIEQKGEFNLDAEGEEKTIVKNGKEYSGYVTYNRLFFEAAVDPVIRESLDALKKQHPVEAINNLALLSHEVYQNYFGPDFYRWGGDIFDLDDPQEKGTRFDKKYGLDCSGFASMPYELAVFYGILDSTSSYAAFASSGFKFLCENTDITDGGGRDELANNYRIDTYDIFRLGRLVLTLDEGEIPTNEQMAILQPGDLVGRKGHVGIIVEIEDELYYLESGGRILPNNGYQPFNAKKALELWAVKRPVYVRRCLMDYSKQDGGK